MQRAGRTLLGALILLILLLAICAAVVYHATSSSAENRRLAQHSIAVMQSAEALLSLTQDAETGQRGYILTRRQQYLGPYQSAMVKIPPAFDTLRGLLTSPAETPDADRLRDAIHTKLFELQKTIDVAQTQGFDAATQIVLTDVGKQAMDEIRQTIRGLVAAEGDLLAANRADVYFWDRVNLIVGGVGGTVVLIALIIAAMMTQRSVSQLERAERSLREQAELLQGTLDNVRDGVVAFDAGGRLTAANRRFFKLLDFPARLSEVGRPLADFLAIEAGRPERIFIDVSASAIEASGEGGIVRRISLDKRDVEVYRNAMPGGGFIVTCKDITLRLRAEAGLRQAQKMESIGQLTGGVAHDFNNLLQVIVGNIEFLIQAAKDAPAMLSRATSALLAAQRGAQLTRHLLAFARRQPLNPVPVNPGRLIQGMTELLRRTLGEQIQIEAMIAGGLWNTLVDPTQLESAILNLAINARDAMPQGGKLTIEVGNAFLDDAYATEHAEVAAGQYVMLAVSDTGAGMSPDVVARAFEPFFTTKPEGEGTGLGLSMVYGFVKQSAGHVKIYSEPGQGTTVKLYLPRERRAEIEIDDTRARAALGGNERILVVEDDAAVRQTAVDMLRQLGYQVSIAENGERALVMLNGGLKVDLLFTDVVMPGPIGSRELARQATSLLPGLFVLFTSGYTENAIIHNGRLDPGVHLLSKPYGIQELGRKLRLVIAGAPGDASEQKPAEGADSAPPRSTAPGAAVSAAPSSSGMNGLGQVLLVEDDALVAMSTMDMLAQIGIAAEQASTGAEALEFFRKDNALTIVIADVGLPDMDGHKLVREIRVLRPAVKIIMATGSLPVVNGAGESDPVDVIHLGKPYQLADLRRALARLMTGA